MAKKKPTSATYDLIVNQGDDFVFQFVLKDGKDRPINIAGCTYECKVRETAEDEAVILTSNCRIVEAENGLVEIHFPSEGTSMIDTDGDTYKDMNEYTYDVIQTSPDGVKTRVLQGMFYVSPGISFH